MPNTATLKPYYIFAAVLAIGTGIFAFLKYYGKYAPALQNKLMGKPTGAHVMNAEGKIMYGIPAPKENTSKGAWCNCANGTRCSGTFGNCNCCKKKTGKLVSSTNWN